VDLIALNLFTISETFPKDRNPNKWGVIIDISGYGYRVLNGLQPHEAEELAKEMYNKVNLMLSNWFYGVVVGCATRPMLALTIFLPQPRTIR
jgi:hypothetical protein